MAMTEWQDVGMSGSEKEQLQAIYDAVIDGQMIYNLPPFSDTLPCDYSFTSGESNPQPYTWTADTDYPFLLAVYDAVSLVRYAGEIMNNCSMDFVLASGTARKHSSDMIFFNEDAQTLYRVALLNNVKEGDTVTITGCPYMTGRFRILCFE